MNKFFKKFSIVFVMLLTIIGVGTIQNEVVANAVTMGKQLTQPEKDWTRFDDCKLYAIAEKGSNVNEGGEVSPGDGSRYYQNTYTSFGGSNLAGDESYIRFKFKGSKIRIISQYSHFSSDNVLIVIDGISFRYNTHSTSDINQVIAFEKIGLEDKEHTVQISVDSQTIPFNISSKLFRISHIDAIDIDDNGYLVDPNHSISLDNSSLNIKVGDSKQLTSTTTPAGAEVNWTSSDELIATVDSTGKVTGIKEGAATITAQIKDTETKATCEVTVTKGDYKDYVIHDKIDWFEVR